MKLLRYCSLGILATYLIATAFIILVAFFILDFEGYTFARISLGVFALTACLAAIRASKGLMHQWQVKQSKPNSLTSIS